MMRQKHIQRPQPKIKAAFSKQRAHRALCTALGAATLLFGCIGPASPVQAQDITTGLVGHWEFDGDYTDSIGANDGSVIGDTTIIDGRVGSGAVYFDGDNDGVDFGDVTIMDGLGQATYCLWVKTSMVLSTETISVLRKDLSFNAFQYSPANGGWRTVLFTPSFIATNVYSEDIVDTNGTWQHFCSVYNGANLTLYKNGQNTGLSFAKSGNIADSAVSLIFGITEANDEDYEGAIDDVRFYNRPLTADDIAELYKQYTLSQCGNSYDAGKIIFNQDYAVMQYCNGTEWVNMGKEASILYGQKSTDTKKLVAWWKLNETSGATITDSSGNGNDGTWTDGVNNDVTEETTTGIVSSALTFDGIDDSIVVASPASMSFASGSSFTVSAWVKVSSCDSSGSKVFEKKQLSYEQLQLQCYSSDNLPRFSVRDSNSIDADAVGSTPINDNNWHLWTGVKDGNTVYLYIDGVLEDTQTAAFTGNWNDGEIRIGDSIDGGPRLIDGKIDDVRVYNYALSSTEVEKIASTAQSCPATDNGLVGYWTMDETSGATIADSSGQGNNGTWTDGVNNNVTDETMAGQVGTALSFDETVNNVITVPHAPELDLNSGYTVSGWVYFDSGAVVDVNPSWISKNNPGGWGSGWAIGRTSGGGNIVDGKIRLITSHARDFNDPDAISFTGWVYPVDTWVYVTITWDGAYNKYYLNGALLASETDAITVPPDTSTGDLLIGFAETNDYSEYQDGALDDLRLYNRALNDTEIAALYGASGGTCNASLCENPIGYSGELIFNSDDNVMQYCDGSEWIGLGPASAGGAGCSGPSGEAGSLIYNSDFDILQYCDGGDWRGIGADPTATVLADGLIGHWKLDETTGSSIVDSAGTSNGTWNDNSGNSVAEETTAGPVNKGITFDGTDDYIDLSATAVGTGSYDDITIAGWYKSAGTSVSDDQYMVILGDPVGGSRDVFMVGIDTAKRVRVLIESTAGNGENYGGTSDVVDQSWHHIAATRTKAVGGDINIYVDGVLEASYEVEDIHEDRTLTILGHSFIGDDPGATEQVNGTLDDIRVYNRALSGGEIAALYELGNP